MTAAEAREIARKSAAEELSDGKIQMLINYVNEEIGIAARQGRFGIESFLDETKLKDVHISDAAREKVCAHFLNQGFSIHRRLASKFSAKDSLCW